MEVVTSLEKWKNKKKEDKSKKLRPGKKMFVRRRKWKDEVDEIKQLEVSYKEFDVTQAETFNDYPLSNKTKMGLEKAGYKAPTAIQKASFVSALKGNDILGAAKTGSGKTLAFLIPVLECLFRQRWTSIAGPGAMIISPTRELAYQTFEVLKKVGKFHDFSAGLVIGGKDVKTEAAHMTRTNILICTPGRLLQHMDETSYFDALNLQILVLDEADRILDLGFKTTLNAVLENLPKDKQTLLFSATQTKSVKDLARLSLKNPAYVSVHEKSKSSTPSGLNQKYIVCKLEDKTNMIFSFVKTHLKTKTIVFLSSCKQVQYINAAFCKLRPGVPVMMLHGRMNQLRRMAIYDEFCRKQFALLFCTDVAARGLDFPAVDWVVQLDCPEDAETYIHRAGRTARYHGEGHALLVLLESEEEAMTEQLKAKKVPITRTEINTEKFTVINSRLESFCAADRELKERAQRCFVSYIRSVFLMKNKSVFSVQSLPLAEYSASLGLAVTPRVRFLKKQEANKTKSKSGLDKNSNIPNEEVSTSMSGSGQFDIDENQNEDQIGELFGIKRKDIFAVSEKEKLEEDKGENPSATAGKKDKLLTKVGAAKKLLKKKYKYNQKILFDEEGDLAESWPPIDPKTYKEELAVLKNEGNSEGINIEEAKLEMKERDEVDRQRHREKVRQRHQETRRKAKELRRQLQAKKEGRQYNPDNEEVVVFLGRDEDQPSDDDSGEVTSDDDVMDHNNAPHKRKAVGEKRNKAASDDDSDDDNADDCTKKRKITEPDTLSDLISDAGLSLEEEEKLALHLLGR